MISNEKKQILYVSNCYVGKEHDFSMLKHEFPPDQPWFKNYYVQLDLGFQGFKEYYECKQLEIPNKKPRKAELTEKQKEENKMMSSKRVTVEHSIGGMKRYRILSDRLRNRDYEFYDNVLGICAGLWNLLITD